MKSTHLTTKRTFLIGQRTQAETRDKAMTMKRNCVCFTLFLLTAIGCQPTDPPAPAESAASSSGVEAIPDDTQQLNAQTVLNEALAEAKAADKSVFIHFKTDT